MKLEVEITEAEIRAAIERKIRVAIAHESDAWNSEKLIKEAVSAAWKRTMLATVDSLLGSNEKLKMMVEAEVEKRIKVRVNAALKTLGVAK